MRGLLNTITFSLTVLVLSGCALLSPIKALTSDPAKPTTNTQKSTRVEHFRDNKRGVDYSLHETHYNQEVKKLTLGQRIGAFISGLSTWAILLTILGLVLFPSATIGFLSSRLRVVGKALYQTVKGIQTAKQGDGKYLEALSNEHDQESLSEINKIRAQV